MSPDTPQCLWRYNQRPPAGGWEAESLGTAAVFPQVSNLEVRAAKRQCEGEAGTPAFQQDGEQPEQKPISWSFPESNSEWSQPLFILTYGESLH